MQGDTYLDTITKSDPGMINNVFPWYDSGNVTSQGEPGDGLVTGEQFLNGQKDIAMSDAPYPYFKSRQPGGTQELDIATFDWDFELVVAAATRDAELEINQGDRRYLYFRRAVATWSYAGAIIDNGPGVDTLVFDPTNPPRVTKGAAGWIPEQNSTLAFDDDDVIRDGNDVPILANVIINVANPWQNGP
jgi:hypothetical protein